MKHCYLAGRIAGDEDPNTWRDEADVLLRRTGEWMGLNPLHYEVVALGNTTPEKIVRMDYGLILKSSAVLVMADHPSWGTAMELAFAKHHGIPVFAIFTRGDEEWVAQSAWLKYHVAGQTFASDVKSGVKVVTSSIY